jgi:hypothetical protein
MKRFILAALVALPTAAVAYPYGQPSTSYGQPWRPTWQQQQDENYRQIQELKRQRMQSCFNSKATIISYEYGC